MAYASISIKGLPQLRAKLRPEPLLAAIWRSTLGDAGTVVKDDAVQHAPRESGRMAANTKSRVTGGVIPQNAVVSTSRVVRGFRVAQALNYSQSRYHYAGTRRSTRDWLTGAPDRVRGRVEGMFEKALGQIEREFDR